MIEMLIPFGLKDNQIFHVESVPNGLACGCICPECRQPLIAKNQGERRRPHFSHAKDTECYDYHAMTYLHQYAQQLIESECKIVLPEFSHTPKIKLKDGSSITGETFTIPEIETSLDNIQSEYSWNQFRIDSFATLKGRSLFIEITVSHDNTPEKISAIEKAEQPAIEVVLTSLYGTDELYDDKAIRSAVFNSKNAKWIHHPRAVEFLKPLYAKLQEEADRLNYEIIQRQKAELARQRIEEEKERVRLERREEAKQQLRSKLDADLSWLNSLSSEWINEYEYSKRKLVPVFPKWVDLETVDCLIGIRVDGYWIFNCCCEHWQALILSFLYKNGMDRAFNANDVKKFVVKFAGINEHMNRLNIAQYEARQKALAKGSKSNWRGAWYLTWEENERIISPYYAVLSYLEHLVACDVLSRSRDLKSFYLKDYKLNDYELRINSESQAEEERKRLREERARLLIEDQERLDREQRKLIERRKAITKELQQKRIVAMIEADKLVFQEHDGEGLRCNSCYFISPNSTLIRDAESECPKCGQVSKLQPEKITKEYIETAIHRYRCSVWPRKSLELLPECDF
ncbi:hypothetical protein [Photobacterium minamisatsumaniensis]|uniref:competence protein CoiA family protein n=1 Tax=Photobacterium minamisatsumaniensis TaxID=2910233 RepID=UPI003D12C53A